ncbi:MAG: HlyC/CorC family transporter [Dehalococcoidia bacterium]|nr:HlyC/CorC family transporter [Dehalococcoidia bacterium]
MDNEHFIYLILFLFCLVGSAFFCSVETAFISIQKLHLSHLIESQNANARVVARIISKPERFLATVLLGINFFETAVATTGTLLAVAFWGENLGAAIATIVVTILTLVFAELIPKSLAARHGERWALKLAHFVDLILTVLYPFVFVLNYIGQRITGAGAKGIDTRPTISEEEFYTAVNIAKAEGVWEEDEAEMLRNVFRFADRPVKEVFTPRVDITWVKQGTTLEHLLEIYRQSPHTKFPVYEDIRDNVTGVLYMKDILLAQANNAIRKEDSIDNFIRPACFVPETKLLGTLMADMKKNKQRVALVVDEFGGIAGMVTIDQLVEEIVGDIGAEIIGEEEDIVPVGANTFEVDGGLRIKEANDELGFDLPAGDYETMAGFVLSHLGRVPVQGEHLRYKNLKMTILEMKGLKIERILVTREPCEEG